MAGECDKGMWALGQAKSITSWEIPGELPDLSESQ